MYSIFYAIAYRKHIFMHVEVGTFEANITIDKRNSQKQEMNFPLETCATHITYMLHINEKSFYFLFSDFFFTDFRKRKAY